MLVTCVHIYVKPDKIDEFISETLNNHKNSLLEEGNYRFDFVQSKTIPNHFMLYEVFRDEEAVNFHRTTAHYLRWKDTVADWMEKPREAIHFNSIAPEEEGLWK